MPPDAHHAGGPEPLEERLHRLVLGAPGGRPSPAGLRSHVERLARAHAPLLGGVALDAVVDAVTARVQGLGPLDPLLGDPDVSEVMVNGPGPVWIERHGRVERVATMLDTPTIERLIERIVAPLGLRVDRSSPLVDARLPDGSRVNAVVPPLAVDGPCLTIRRFGARRFTLEDLCPPAVAELLSWAVQARANVVVSGGTGAGKTTLLNALGAAIPPGERVVTVEDAAELRLPGDHVVRLEARPANAEGVGEVPLRQLVRNALRMRPDRIIVGEVRGPEALDMLQAMNTGHEGSLSTCHANAPTDALRRLETMVLTGSVALPLAAVREQIHAAIDLVVQVARTPEGGRRVVEVAEVDRAAEARPGSAWVRTRSLTDGHHLAHLPRRGRRLPAAPPPDPAWVTAPPSPERT
ncbi:MAG TPA: CpaF family protein [Acidimicrobiales bacterium]|nr:CpaF family protein [Acidimicrobiales bacterium]HWH34157.1 CpaF family protein [Acidimicrobiales bacterium]